MSGDDVDDELVRRAQEMIGAVVQKKWTLVRLIGVGGMAVVYEAVHRNKKRAAIKMLHPELSLEPRIRARFVREGYVANSVGHPGAVRVDDDDVTEEGAAFLVMELLDGETVEARRRRQGGRLSAREALPIAYQLLDVLAAAHESGIVHRDLKPDNLFLKRDGKLKVLDFGIARLHELSGDVVRTKTGSLLGTPAFMAPEQARGRWDLVDARTDLWAVGATLFTLLSGRHVHEAQTLNEALAMAVTQPPRPIGSVVFDVDPQVAELVDRALAYHPGERWPDARTMQQVVASAYSALTGNVAALPALAGLAGADAPAGSIDVDVEIRMDPTPPAVSELAERPQAPHPLLATAPAVTTGLGSAKRSRQRPLLWSLLAVGVILALSASATLLLRFEDGNREPASARTPARPESAPPVDPLSVVPAAEPVASVVLPDPANDARPRSRPPAAVSLSKPRRQTVPEPTSAPDRSQAPSHDSATAMPDPFAKRR